MIEAEERIRAAVNDLTLAVGKLRRLWEDGRCPLCGGPIEPKGTAGCHLGDCSYRPDGPASREMKQIQMDLLRRLGINP